MSAATLLSMDSPAISPSNPATSVIVAGFWRRWLAALLDAMLLGPVLLLVAFIAFKITGLPFPRPGHLRPEAVLEMVISGQSVLYGTVLMVLLLVMLYGALFLSVTGATPGLKLLGMKVISVYGRHPEPWRVVLRCLGFLVSCLLLGTGFLWIGFDREKRGLPDWLAGTYVIRTRM